jgi:hypothetical protein
LIRLLVLLSDFYPVNPVKEVIKNITKEAYKMNPAPLISMPLACRGRVNETINPAVAGWIASREIGGISANKQTLLIPRA